MKEDPSDGRIMKENSSEGQMRTASETNIEFHLNWKTDST